jgi:hypothetical protein
MAPEALSNQANAEYFLVERPVTAASTTSIHEVVVVVENLGTVDSVVTIQSSAYADDPSFDPFVATYGTTFTGSFGNTQTVTVKPGGTGKYNFTFAEAIRFLRLVNLGAQVKVTVTSTTELARL